jgi:D-beta-D-heptose 7-phosphate kinase/D-beta-D-heptose 1-phosphate adenosyltransferase
MTVDNFQRLLNEARGLKVAVIGDLMLDEYVWGDVTRISPDAPVQVVDIRRRSSAIGGAGNVAHNLRVAGGEVILIGAVGMDSAAATLSRLLQDASIDGSGLVQVEGRPTTVKTRVIARGQQMLRLDSEDRSPLQPGDRAKLIEAARRTLAKCSAILISDYAKGVVDRHLVADIAELTRNAAVRVPILVDPKLPDFTAYRGCDVITPNRKEAEAAAGMAIGTEHDLQKAAQRIRERSGAAHVLVTLGERGMALSRPDGSIEMIPAQAHEVFDVTGAGDTVLAYFGLVLASGVDAGDAARVANAAAGVAVAKLGTTAVAPHEVLAAVAGAGRSTKTVDLLQAIARVEHERSLGRSIVFTNGCFDLLHAGHVHLLEQARALGDFLVVGMNSDASVTQLKGNGRPVIGESDRAKVLSALDSVDLVVVFDDVTPSNLINQIHPDVLVKGGDYTTETIVGADEVLARGGRVETVPLLVGRSTTEILEALKLLVTLRLNHNSRN